MITKLDYGRAFARGLQKSKYNLLLAVKCYPSRSESNPDEGMMLADAIFAAVQTMTPRELLEVFPLDKRFDGSKYEEKDYFFSMEFIENYGLDRRIENAFEFLWEYWNADIYHFFMNYLLFVNDRYWEKTGTTLGQGYMEHKRHPYNMISGDGLYVTTYDGETRVEVPNLPMWREQGLI